MQMQYSELLLIVNEIYTEMLNDLALEQNADNVEALLVEIAGIPRSINTGSLYTINEVQVIWDRMSEGPKTPIRTLFLSASSRLYFRVVSYETLDQDIQETVWNNFIRSVAGSLGHFRDFTVSEKSGADMDFNKRGHTTKEWVEFLTNNQWLIFPILLRIMSIDFIDDMRKKSALDAKRKRGQRKEPTE